MITTIIIISLIALFSKKLSERKQKQAQESQPAIG